MSLPSTDAAGVVQTTPTGVPVSWNGGLAYDAAGLLCVTNTLSPTDVGIGGLRVSDVGKLVITAASPTGSPFNYNGGWPTDKVTGATIVQTGVPDSTDPRVGGVAIGPLGGVYVSNAGSPTFTPAELDLVQWIMPSDFSTLFQDVGMTIPVTAEEQLVAVAVDKSGNGYNWVQSSTALQAVITSGPDGKSPLKFDGVDDEYDVGSMPTETVEVFVGVSNPIEKFSVLWSWASGAYPTNVYFGASVRGDPNAPNYNAGVPLNPVNYVNNAVLTPNTQDQLQVEYLNGPLIYLAEALPLPLPGVVSTIGQLRGLSSFAFGGYIYSWIVARNVTPEQRAATQAWIASEMGLAWPPPGGFSSGFSSGFAT